jgi:hypothetical protein
MKGTIYKISGIFFVSSLVLLFVFFFSNQPNTDLVSEIAFIVLLISAGGIAVTYPSKTKIEKICRWITGTLVVLTGVFLALASLLGDPSPGSEGGEFGILFGLPALFLFYPLAILMALILTSVGFFKAVKNK